MPIAWNLRIETHGGHDEVIQMGWARAGPGRPGLAPLPRAVPSPTSSSPRTWLEHGNRDVPMFYILIKNNHNSNDNKS